MDKITEDGRFFGGKKRKKRERDKVFSFWSNFKILPLGTVRS